MMKESEIIHNVIDLLSKPGSWIKEVRAKTADEYIVSPTNPDAVKFCLGGAVMHVLGDEMWTGWWSSTEDPVGLRFHKLAIERGFVGDEWSYPFVEFNNDLDTTHEDMMLFLKEALNEAETEEDSR